MNCWYSHDCSLIVMVVSLYRKDMGDKTGSLLLLGIDGDLGGLSLSSASMEPEYFLVPSVKKAYLDKSQRTLSVRAIPFGMRYVSGPIFLLCGLCITIIMST